MNEPRTICPECERAVLPGGIATLSIHPEGHIVVACVPTSGGEIVWQPQTDAYITFSCICGCEWAWRIENGEDYDSEDVITFEGVALS
jgi:RNase P subunit RPR2